MMRYTLKALTICLGLLVTQSASAQSNHCGYDELHQYYLENDPGYAARLQDIEVNLQQNSLQGTSRKKSLITIPVVIHVVHNGEAVGVGRNISDAQILSQIDVLNEDYRNLNSDAGLVPSAFQSFVTDMSIEFCLAVRDPNGAPTSGIERLDGGQPTWIMSEVEADLKPATIWDPSKYLNIWTLQLGGSNAGTLGYSSKPGQPATTDGVVVQFRYFGRVGNLTAPFNKGRTATHEIGHFFGLDHLWGLGEPNVSACGDDDGITDTPVQSKANYSCPSFPSVSCSNGPNGDMFMNYMDYVNDACMFMFTNGQKSRVDNFISTLRSDLATSNACNLYTLDAALVSVVYPQGVVCQNTFTPVVAVQNSGSQTITSLLINMVVNQSSFQQQQWTGSLATGETAYIPINAVTLADGPHDLNIYVSNPNNGVDELPDNDTKDISIVVANEANVFSLSLPVQEGFETPNFPPTLWEVFSTGGATSAWGVTSAGGFGTSANGVAVDFFSSNTTGHKQSLVSPYFEVPAGNTVSLSFNYAYARKDSLTNDTLGVYFSFDCGNTWTEFWRKEGIRLQTAPIQNLSFVPTAAQWEQAAGINLPQSSGQSRVRIKFEASSDNGNNIYLDDINLVYWVVGVSEALIPNRVINLYPNPAANSITIQEEGASFESHTISLFDLQGRLIHVQLATDLHNGHTIDVSALNSGMYLVKVSNKAGDVYKKLLVQ